MRTKGPRFIDLTGKRFGLLTVLRMGELRHARNGQPKQTWICACDCGAERTVYGIALRHGQTKSCGCLQPAVVALMSTKHGMSGTPEFKTWAQMISRCENARLPDFKLYGARGIKVCERWRADFLAFYADMGPRPSPRHSIDRINSNGDYELANCRWALPVVQARNTARNVYVEINGERMCAAEAADRFGIKRPTLYSRLARGVDPRVALNITEG